MGWVIKKNGQNFSATTDNITQIELTLDTNTGSQNDVYKVTYTDVNGCESYEKEIIVPTGDCSKYYVCSVPCYDKIDSSNYKNINIRYYVDEDNYAVKKPLNALGKTIEGITIKEEDVYFYSTAPACTATILYPSSIKNKERDTSPTGDGVNLTTSNNTHDFQLYESVLLSVPKESKATDCSEAFTKIYYKSTKAITHVCDIDVWIGLHLTYMSTNNVRKETDYALSAEARWFQTATAQNPDGYVENINEKLKENIDDFHHSVSYRVDYVVFFNNNENVTSYYCKCSEGEACVGDCIWLYTQQGKQTGGNGSGNGNGTAGELPDPGNENQGNENNNDEHGHHDSGLDEPQVQP